MNSSALFAKLKLFSHLLFVFGLLSFGASAQKYEGAPATKEGLVKALRSKQFQTRDIVQRINAKGVDFQLTPDAESELVAAGARPQVLEAVRANYRAASPVNPAPQPIRNNGSSNTNANFTGTPLSKDAVVALLQNGVKDAQVQQNVRQRGVSFQMNPQIAREIKAAGGSDALVGVMFSSYSGGAADSGGGNRPNKNAAGNVIETSNSAAANSYDGLIDQAVDLYDNKKDKPGAVASLQKAVALAPTSPRAYQLVGYMSLYGMQNFADAENNWRKAIELGGSAVLRVFHDHNGVFTETCNGSLYISKDGVRFESDNNVHTFDTPDANIKSVKVNNTFLRAFQTKAGSYKIALKGGDDSGGKNFNFAPLTGSTEESKMVVRLIGKKD